MRPVLYLRKELAGGSKDRYNVIAYKSADAPLPPVCYWPWYVGSCPKGSDKTVMHNCVRYDVVWLPKLVAA